MVIPTMALAAINTTGAGLVPCGVNTDPNSASNPITSTQCEACNLVQLIQNIITFLIGISVPIAMAMFTYAGILYFTSASGGSENISKAKKIFSSSAFGFVLALCSWLIVNTVLYTVLDHNQYPNSSWFHIDCSSAPRQVANNIGTVLANHLGIAPPVVNTATTPSYACDTKAGYALTTINGTQVCINEAGKKVTPTITQAFSGGSGVLCSNSNLACSPQALVSQGNVSQARANAMSCIAITESSGDPSQVNKSGGACGTFQVLPSNWNNPALHSGNCSSNVSCNNAECNMQTAIALGNARKASGQSYYSDWTCPGCNNKAAACVAKYDPGN